MHLPTAQQLRDWDQYTVRLQGIAFWDLMERAATACVQWLATHLPHQKKYTAICGTGNNGGDGLAIVRLLLQKGLDAKAVVLQPKGKTLAPDAERNLQLLPANLVQIVGCDELVSIDADAVIIDCLFGTGLNRPLDETYRKWISHINRHPASVIAVDLPSGLLADAPTPPDSPVITATHTLSFETYKLGLLAAPNAGFTGNVYLLPIGLEPGFWKSQHTNFFTTTLADAQQWYRPRSRFSHKGDYGHAVIIGGSKGMMGAALMAVGSCLRSGVGLCTAVVPNCGYSMMQWAHPEAMCMTADADDYVAAVPALPQQTTAVGIGPGLGKDVRTEKAVFQFISTTTLPLVVDADGINILSRNKTNRQQLPKGSVLTPHPKEFSRLFDAGMDWWEQLTVVQREVQDLQLVMVLKGHHTLIALPDGRVWFNTTGNHALAKGGSGDVLTGLITGLLAQGYVAADAARLGVWLHGRAADIGVQHLAAECLLPTDLVHYFSAAFREISGV